MSVYVDDMRAPYGRMIMCHMIADTTAELHAMAGAICVARRWLQKAGTAEEHYDVSLAMKNRAIELGAAPITMRQLAAKVRARRDAERNASDADYAQRIAGSALEGRRDG